MNDHDRSALVDLALAKCARVEAACEHTSGCPELDATLARAHELLGMPERPGPVMALELTCDEVERQRRVIGLLRSEVANLRRRVNR